MKKERFRMTLGMKMVILTLLFSVALIGAALFLSYFVFDLMNVQSYVNLGDALTTVMVDEVQVWELDQYFEMVDLDDPETWRAQYKPDFRYAGIEQFLVQLVTDKETGDVYIGRAVEGLGILILFNSRLDGKNVFDAGHLPLGTTHMSKAFSERFDDLLQGVKVDEIFDYDGSVMTVSAPFYRGDGTPSGYYAFVDIPLGTVVNTRNTYMGALFAVLGVLTVIFLIIYLLVIRSSFIKPMASITRAARSSAEGAGSEAFEGLKVKGSFEFQTLSDNFCLMLRKIEENDRRQRDLAVREQRLQSEMSIANDLNMAVLPRELPPRDEAYPFRVQGLIKPGEGLTCCFYDYFLLPGDRLCVMVGEVPGGGVPQVLYTVMAQAAVKSRLMSELPLGEAMTSANRQLFEMGRDICLNVLVGILDGISGSFTFINAGERQPLLMRGMERYDWVDGGPGAPLGQNENVVYREAALQLGQGDRLFFHTEGLDAALGQNGDQFDQKRLRMALNEKKCREAELDRMLPEILAACREAANGEAEVGYAVMALEYIRRDKAQAHCVLKADGSGASLLSAFLREQLMANDITGRKAAQMMVLGDELFTLCCRRAGAHGKMMAECSVRDGVAVLRLRADFGGIDPIAKQSEEPAKNAAAFIERNCERVSFEHGQSQDTVTIVKRVGDGESH